VIEYAKKLERMIWMSNSEKKQALKGLDGVSDCRKEYEEADWEECKRQIAPTCQSDEGFDKLV